jgi:hypothetical protein
MKSPILFSILILLTYNLLLGQTTTSTYYFAHSLIWHQKSNSNQANIPYWLAEMEKATGDICLTSGNFAPGQMGAAALPPTQSWSFYYVNENHGSAMKPNDAYKTNAHDNVVLTYMNWEIVYDYGLNIGSRIPATNPKATDSIARIFRWMNTNDPGRNLYLYECWPKIETNFILDGGNWNLTTGNPPNATQWVKYLAYSLDNSNNFWKDLQDSLISKSKIANVKLIPSSMICAKLWQPGGLLADIPVTSIFEDIGPHGKPSSYFLAAMVVYAAQHKKAPTKPFNSHAQIDQRILDRFSQISTFIISELTAFNFPNGSSRVWYNAVTDIEKPVQVGESKIMVYPNPTNDHITIDFGGYANMSGYTLKVTNTLGTTLFTTAINQKTSNVDLKDWCGHGIYFIYIIDKEGNTIDIKKIIKQ